MLNLFQRNSQPSCVSLQEVEAVPKPWHHVSKGAAADPKRLFGCIPLT